MFGKKNKTVEDSSVIELEPILKEEDMALDSNSATGEQNYKKAYDDSGEKIEPIIRAKNLDFIYNQGKLNEFHALINISLEIYPEEFIIVFGPSGCGKSTLLNVIAGLEKPDKGSIFVYDQDLMKMNAYDFAMYHRTRIGMVFQAYNLITSLTVLQNVVLPQIFVNVRKRKREEWGRELLERFGIAAHANKIPTELSGGQQQRIGIARSIVNNPSIILADEPLGNLDSSSAQIALDIISDLNEKEKKTVIMVTHNPENLDYADRIFYMKDGQITKEVINREKRGKREIEKPKPIMNVINELMRAYQGLTPEQINILIMPFKSKVFAHHFISTRNMEETKVFEEAIQRRLMGTISENEFFNILDRPSQKGGVGFDSRTALKIIRRINRVIRMAYYVYQKTHQLKDANGAHNKVTYDEKADKVTFYLYNTCYKEYYQHMSKEQDQRMRVAVKDRLMDVFDKAAFYDYLDKSEKNGGVGLNSKTAKIISEELELILILGFGVVGVSEQFAKMTNSERNKHKEDQKKALGGAIENTHLSEMSESEKDEVDEEVLTPSEMLDRMNEQLNQSAGLADSDLDKVSRALNSQKVETSEPSPDSLTIDKGDEVKVTDERANLPREENPDDIIGGK